MEKAGSSGKSAFYTFVRVLAQVVLRTFMPVSYHHIERLRNREGAFVIISNHRHALDPVILALPVRDECVFLAKKELAEKPIARKLLLKLHCILVDRHNMDMEAMRACMNALKENRPLVIFPEGTRHHEGQMEQIENGTSFIVLRGKAPLVPVYLSGPLKLFHRIHAYVGEPVEYGDLLEKGVNRDTCEALNQRMRETYRRMISEYGSEENPVC